MSLEVNQNKAVDYAVTGTKAAATGAVIGGSYKIARNLAPLAKDCFKSSIAAQEVKISEFKETGKTVAEYVGKQRKDIQGLFTKPGTLIKAAGNLTKNIAEEGKAPKIVYATPEKAAQGARLEKMIGQVAEKGKEGVLKDIDKTEKLLTKGSASKMEAAKETVVKMFKNKGAYLRENKAAILKKAGKTALIGAAVAGAIAFASKAILEAKAKKAEDAE